MSLNDLAANGWIKPHKTSRNEIADLLSVVERDLKDALIEGISDDRRFATAYNAALQLSKIVIAASGYLPTKGQSVHFQSFETVKAAISNPLVEKLCDYFDTCRRKRNHIDYDASEIVTLTETIEIIIKTQDYRLLVIEWLKTSRPDLISN